MKILDTINFAGTDGRVRKNIFPVKVIKTFGKVENADCLLKEKPLQITTAEPELALLENDGSSAENAAVLLDFGTEINGSLRFINYGVVGSQYADVRITLGESAAEALSSVGEKGATNDHTTRDMTVTVQNYSDQEIGETGFRFACIRLLTPDTRLTIKSLLAVLVYRDIEYKGSFSCDDELLNQIYDTAAYTCHLCMQKMLWDGVKRDRLVWVGDMHPEMLTIRTVFGDSEVMDEAIRFARETTPLPAWMNNMAPYSIWWLRILWDWYFYTGNRELLEENKDYALALIRQLADYVSYDGSDTFDYDFLDWPTANTPAGTAGVKGLLAYGLDAAAGLAGEIGDVALADECGKKLGAMRNREIESHGAKQTAALLAFGGIADNEKSAGMILEGGASGISTFMSYYILSVAAKKSMNGALDMLRDYYGGMLKMGATTFWEDFDIEWLKNACPIDEIVPEGKSDIHGDNGRYCYQGFRHSFCHGWSSGPTAFLAEKVLGIKIAAVGCKKIVISPDLGNLKWAKGTYPTPYGILTVSHKREADGSISTEYTAPKEIKIEIC